MSWLVLAAIVAAILHVIADDLRSDRSHGPIL